MTMALKGYEYVGDSNQSCIIVIFVAFIMSLLWRLRFGVQELPVAVVVVSGDGPRPVAGGACMQGLVQRGASRPARPFSSYDFVELFLFKNK